MAQENSGENGLLKAYDGLPDWAKGALAVGLLLGIGFVVKKLIETPKKIKEGGHSRDQDKGEVDEELTLIEQGKKATLTKSSMQSIANVIFSAVDGYGTDEDGIIRQMAKIKNNLDYLGVSRAWGIRTVSSGKWNPEPNFKGKLPAALQNELSDYWIKKINSKLAANKVTYRV